MNLNEEFMKQALKRINELQNETIEKSKEMPNSEAYIKEQIQLSGIVSTSRCKRCHKVLNISELKINPDGVGRVCIDEETCKKRIKKLSR